MMLPVIVIVVVIIARGGDGAVQVRSDEGSVWLMAWKRWHPPA